MSDPYAPDNMSTTLKQDGKDGTWSVFHGSPSRVREQILEYFGWGDSEEMTKLTPHELVIEATRAYKGSFNVGRTLGGRPTGSTASVTVTGSVGSAWEKAREEPTPEQPAEPERNPLFDEIENVGDVPALRELFARNKANFDADPELLAAWKAKGKKLQEAA